MKTIVAVICMVAFVWAEPPPSNSYLPPPSASRAAGYPSGGPGSHGQFGAGPQVIAARALNHDHRGANEFGRNSGSHNQAAARFGGLDHDHKHGQRGQGYDQNASPFGRNGVDDSQEPANYNFGYMVNDFQEGTDFGHHEARQDERAEGEYHVVLPDGRKQTVSYEADERGFKPQISYEDTDALGRSNDGYDDNANNLHGNHGNGYKNGGHSGRSNGY